MTATTTPKTQPAKVRGNVRTAIAVFIEDSNGDLVDIEYHCEDFAGAEGALPWPGFEFAADYDSYCIDCGSLIHNHRGGEIR